MHLYIIFFCSSSQTVFGRPQCPPVSAPCVEESQALGKSQVRTHLKFRERSSVHTIPCSSLRGDVKSHIIFSMKHIYLSIASQVQFRASLAFPG